MDVAAWLRGFGLEQYAPAFCDNYVDADVLSDLMADDRWRGRDHAVALVRSRLDRIPRRRNPLLYRRHNHSDRG